LGQNGSIGGDKVKKYLFGRESNPDRRIYDPLYTPSRQPIAISKNIHNGMFLHIQIYELSPENF